jgi:hypothetical protein
MRSHLIEKNESGGYPIAPVPFTAVKVTGYFREQRLKASREVTIPLAFGKCEETGRYGNFVRAAHPNVEYKVEGYSFDDTDVYKTIEGASEESSHNSPFMFFCKTGVFSVCLHLHENNFIKTGYDIKGEIHEPLHRFWFQETVRYRGKQGFAD